MQNVISIDIQSTCKKGIFDVYIATEGSSGAHYPEATADQVGEHVANLIDCLEEASLEENN